MASVKPTDGINPDAQAEETETALPTDETIWKKTKLIFENITVEPVMICYILPYIMSNLAVQNLNLDKACRVNLQYNSSVCDALTVRNLSGYTKDEEVEVQKLVATMAAWKSVIQSLVPSVIIMFFGSWSDRNNRRKPCIMLPIYGEASTVIGFLLCTYYFYELPMEVNGIAETVIPALTGGWFAVTMGVYAYVSTISSLETRTLRIGAVSMFTNVSVTIGMALSGVLLRQIGFYGVFSLALCIYAVALIYGQVTIKENNLNQTKSVEETCSAPKKNFFVDFFDPSHIKETLRVAFKNDVRNRKKRICTIMVLVMVIIGPLHGEMTVMYLFVRYKFTWDEIDYSIFSTFAFVVHMCGTMFALIFFTKYLKIDDAMLGILSSASKILASLVYTFAPSPGVFYIGAIVEMLNGTSFIAMRSIVSKLVSPDELGKINSLFGVCEALMPLAYGPMYSLVYTSTIDYVPGAFFLLGGFLTTPALFIFFWLYKEHKKDEIEELQSKKEKAELLTIATEQL